MALRRRQRVALVASGVALACAGGAFWLLRTRPEAARYRPGERTEGVTSVLTREDTGGAAGVSFREVAAESGIAFTHFHGRRSSQLPEDMGSGLAWGDYDGDGDDDLLAANVAGPLPGRTSWASSPARARLFRNEGGGRFADVTAETGLRGPELGMAATFADFDGDADLDVFLTGVDEVVLLRNDGGRFGDVTAASGLAQPGFWSGAAWADYDGDGDLDLYVGRYVEYTGGGGESGRQYGTTVPYTLNPSSYRPATNALYRNDGGGRFMDVAAAAGVTDATGRSLQVVFSDLDADGRPDLYVANDVSDNALFHNRGDGTFASVGHEAWVADYRGAMGLAVADENGDGVLDLFITHWLAQENALYRGLGPKAGLKFADVADSVGLGQIALDYVGWGAAFLDADRDGRLDLAVANGSTLQDPRDSARLVPMRTLLFHNTGGKSGYVEIGARAGEFFSRLIGGRGLAVSDFDGDGDPDLAILCHGGPLALLRNESASDGHWLGVRLRDRAPNVFAVGARVTVRAGGGRQMREVQVGSSYLSQHSLDVHFGLGARAAVDAIEVRWPDGTVETHPRPAVDRLLVLTRGAAGAGPVDRARFWTVFREARAALAKRDLAAAEVGLNEALALDPKHTQSLKLLGIVQGERGRWREAVGTWERLLALAQGPDVHFHLGAAHACLEPEAPFDAARARREFEAVLRANPEQTGPFTRLAELSLLAGDDAAAASALGHVTATNRVDVAARFLQGYLHWRAGRPADARRELAAAAEAARNPIRAKIEASAEGDTENVLASRLDACRPFAEHWRDLGARLPPAGPSEADTKRVYETAAAWHAARR